MNNLTSNERIIRSVETSMNTEGFIMSEAVKKDCLEMLEGKTTADDLVKKYINKYKRS